MKSKKKNRMLSWDKISMGEAHHHTSLRKTSKAHKSKTKYTRKGKARWQSPPAPTNPNTQTYLYADTSL